MSELPPDLVSYNRPVRCVHWVDSPNGRSVVEVECDDGERIVADHVIVTVPLGTLSTPPYFVVIALSTLVNCLCGITYYGCHRISIKRERM